MDFLKKTNDRLELITDRETILEELRNAKILFDIEILPVIDNFIKLANNDKITNKHLKYLNNRSDLNALNNSSFFRKIKEASLEVIDYSDQLVVLANKLLPEAIVKDNLSLRQSIIIDEIVKVLDFILNINGFLYTGFSLFGNGDDSPFLKEQSGKKTVEIFKVDLSKGVLKEFDSNLTVVGSLISYFNGRTQKIIKSINTVPDVSVKKMEENNSIMKSFTNIFSNFNVDRFIGNPIYHFRIFLADWSDRRFKKRIDRKRLMEMKLEELRMDQQGASDPELTKQIEKLQKKIDVEDKEIREYIEENS
jgi:hypothetical protein